VDGWVRVLKRRHEEDRVVIGDVKRGTSAKRWG